MAPHQRRRPQNISAHDCLKRNDVLPHTHTTKYTYTQSSMEETEKIVIDRRWETKKKEPHLSGLPTMIHAQICIGTTMESSKSLTCGDAIIQHTDTTRKKEEGELVIRCQLNIVERTDWMDKFLLPGSAGTPLRIPFSFFYLFI